MNILVDQNISFRVIKKIENVLPEVNHINEFDLVNASDHEIWEFARTNGYCILTFGSDFIEISMVRGFPPKVIWLRIGNTSTEVVARKLISEQNRIKEFLKAPASAILQIG